MNILILGSGGREHAIAWKLKQSKKLENLFIAPGNAGTDALGTNVPLPLNDFEAIASFIQAEGIELLVVGPEAPLVDGITNYFRANSNFSNLKIIGKQKEFNSNKTHEESRYNPLVTPNPNSNLTQA